MPASGEGDSQQTARVTACAGRMEGCVGVETWVATAERRGVSTQSFRPIEVERAAGGCLRQGASRGQQCVGGGGGGRDSTAQQWWFVRRLADLAVMTAARNITYDGRMQPCKGMGATCSQSLAYLT